MRLSLLDLLDELLVSAPCLVLGHMDVDRELGMALERLVDLAEEHLLRLGVVSPLAQPFARAHQRERGHACCFDGRRQKVFQCVHPFALGG